MLYYYNSKICVIINNICVNIMLFLQYSITTIFCVKSEIRNDQRKMNKNKN